MISERPKRSGVMLCYPFEEKRLAKWSPPYLIQPKLDGVRCRAVWDAQRESYYLLSSTEHEITSCPHIVAALNKQSMTAELDGELYCHGMSFEKIYSRTSRTENLHERHFDIEFHVFDIIAAGSQVERLTWLVGQQFDDSITMVEFRLCGNLGEILSYYDQLLNKGYEGIICRHIDALYVRRRNTFIMKFKPKKDDWYNVVGVQEEIDKYGIPKGTLGAIICMGDDGTRFGVGTGLTRDQRAELWSRKHKLLGGLCHVQYQHITPGKNVPRFPVFISVDEGSLPDEAA